MTRNLSRLPPLAARTRGLTLIELMLVVALIGVLVALAGPSMKEAIEVRRLRGINAQLVTDFQFARSEAISKRMVAKIDFNTSVAGLTCYSIYTSTLPLQRCDCAQPQASRCSLGATEIRTVQIPNSTATLLSIPDGQFPAFGFEPAMGGLISIPVDDVPASIERFYVDTAIDAQRSLRVLLSRSGRPTVCATSGSKIAVAACPT